MHKERFTRTDFDNSRSLLRSFVSDFHFSLFEALEKIDDLRCIVEEDEDFGDVFYYFIKHYGEQSERVVFSDMFLLEVEAFIFEEFQRSIMDANYRSKVSLYFKFNDCYSVLPLSAAQSVSLLIDYIKRDMNAVDYFDIHIMSKISLIFLDEDGNFSSRCSLEEFEELQPTLFYYLKRNGLL